MAWMRDVPLERIRADIARESRVDLIVLPFSIIDLVGVIASREPEELDVALRS
jgi:hypothetical protein